MKRYMLFGFDQYYPLGGMKDFIDSFANQDDALKYAIEHHEDMFHIYDLITNEIIWSSKSD